MAQFDDHANQAERNLQFLEQINGNVKDCVDWQVTVCFYTALHLINAHLANFGLQYRTHNSVKDALNPERQTSVSKLPENEYTAYVGLQMLSRRSRYLVNEKDGQTSSQQAALTNEKHLVKALRNLDKLLMFFVTSYGRPMPHINVYCDRLKPQNDLQYMQVGTK